MRFIALASTLILTSFALPTPPNKPISEITSGDISIQPATSSPHHRSTPQPRDDDVILVGNVQYVTDRSRYGEPPMRSIITTFKGDAKCHKLNEKQAAIGFNWVWVEKGYKCALYYEEVGPQNDYQAEADCPTGMVFQYGAIGDENVGYDGDLLLKGGDWWPTSYRCGM